MARVVAQTTSTAFPAFWPKVKIQMPGRQRLCSPTSPPPRPSPSTISVSCPFRLFPSAVTGFHSSGIPYVNGYHNSCETRKKERRTKRTNERGKERESEREREREREEQEEEEEDKNSRRAFRNRASAYRTGGLTELPLSQTPCKGCS